MAEKGLTAEYRCGYCYQEFNLMTNPKKLPCHHVFCLTCLRGDFEERSLLCCATCQAVHELKNFDELPTATLDVNDEVTTTSTSLRCDGETCDGQLAVCYCIQCAHKICDSHQQSHSHLFGEHHEVVSIFEYETSPGIYKRAVCQQHQVEFTKACRHCDTLVCRQCDAFSDKCEDNKRHKFYSLDHFERQLTSRFAELLSRVSEKLTEICKLDKKIWRTLDQEEVACKEMINTIECYIDEQILRIRAEGKKLKEQVYDYQRRLTIQVEVYNSELMAKKEQLEMSRTKVHRWLRDSHVAEKIQQRHEMVEKCLNDLHLELDSYMFTSRSVLIFRDVVVQLDLSVNQVPIALSFVSEHKTKSECYSVHHREDGDLIVSCYNRVAHISREKSLSINYTEVQGTPAALDHHGVIYVVRTIGQTCKLELCSPNLEIRHQLLEFRHPSLSVASFAISNKYIAITNRSFSQILLYDFISKQTRTLVVEVTPTVISFLPDGDLLATNFTSAVLTKYHIKDGKLTTVWTCDRLQSAYGVCTDGEGLIYVSSLRHKIVYIISPQGQMLQELRHDRLPATTGQISVRGNELVVPGWADDKLCVFKLKY